ncbi:MaoC/PaaZ C-terminal domain-containing protein [Brevibacillus nitrificans]|uniref:MaoC/PaaZ C-terminal domain-containing protein n=1 Tax=Brevibacillus nitrificans TaxID=651560 RepID=UPI00285D7501|nr:MaoC/PaaZ C-terminal domain-containing protein [Brevibacillus nitrificans]MDR7319133.1 acyl dehydratase [Brevibacillus nitrificans]
MFTKYLDHYEVGETWVSRGRTITEADIVHFAGLSGDWFPLHTDKEYAAKTPFQERIAHGLLVLSVASGLYQFGVGIVIALYGMENVRFTNPTFIGDTIHLENKVLSVEEKPGDRGVVTVLQEIKKQTGELVCTCTLKIMVKKAALVEVE